jgi:hypothetical protein
MSYRKVIYPIVALALIIAAFASWYFLARPPSPKVTLSFAGYSTNSLGQKVMSFTFTNGSQYRIMSPDACGIQFKGDDRPVMINLRDIYLPPGSAENITIVPQAAHGIWRVGLNQYAEDRANKLNMGYDGKPRVRRFIPMRLRAVYGYWVWSAWFTNDEKSN